jgi:23S rRNA (guanosine2251-2'-O)-methyltransferase
MLIYGINPVLEALKARRVTLLRVGSRADDRVRQIERLAGEQGVSVRRVGAEELDRAAGGPAHRHQGVVADVDGVAHLGVEDLIAGAAGAALIVVLDGIEDPHNMGAILRTVDAAGGGGVVRQSRHAAPLGGATAKASAGAVAHVRIADVVNIARSLEVLKEAGVWTVGLAGDATKRYDEVDYRLPTALVVGAEGTGMRRLVRERCDWLVSIPMRGHVQSLNVSVATGIVLFEAVRQRQVAAHPAARTTPGRPQARS